jgi:hypothetical protein
MTKLEKEEIKKKIEDHSIYEEPKYKKWRGRIFKRDGYACQFPTCKWPMGTIAGHHIRMKWYNPELIYALTNGITLCDYHHKYIHKRGSDNYVEVFEEIALKNIEKPKVSKKKARKIKTMSKKLVKKILLNNKKKGKKRVIRFTKYSGQLVRTL